MSTRYEGEGNYLTSLRYAISDVRLERSGETQTACAKACFDGVFRLLNYYRASARHHIPFA
jgi:hypothetical protein